MITKLEALILYDGIFIATYVASVLGNLTSLWFIIKARAPVEYDPEWDLRALMLRQLLQIPYVKERGKIIKTIILYTLYKNSMDLGRIERLR